VPLSREQHGEESVADAEPLGLVVLAERLRPNVSRTIAFLIEQGVDVKVLSGDSPQTVAAIARDAGIRVRGVGVGAEIPQERDRRAEWALDASVVGGSPRRASAKSCRR
jgi:cation-transporting ATPase E